MNIRKFTTLENKPSIFSYASLSFSFFSFLVLMHYRHPLLAFQISTFFPETVLSTIHNLIKFLLLWENYSHVMYEVLPDFAESVQLLCLCLNCISNLLSSIVDTHSQESVHRCCGNVNFPLTQADINKPSVLRFLASSKFLFFLNIMHDTTSV